ncbi:epsin-1 isoform X2 [Pieris napi]|uniref:epsin-1 isoform X2 n=1 Tax=Pieris napi TaxID=78633 RepID=UPI001FBAC247|nr:epsin-1 isoform X2 [Pieris napi]
MQVNVAGLRRNIKNLAHNYSDAQVKVREATSNDPWGPSSTLMADIADLTYNVMAFTEIMQMIWKRLNDHGKNWRHVYKALVLMEYLIKTGSEKVAMQCKENIFAIHTLKDFQYMEEGKDQGLNVREKAKQLVHLLKDEERLKNERARALKAKQRFAQTASAFGSDGALDTPSSPTYPALSGSGEWASGGPGNGRESELARPLTAGEEELQLQLALAMSREEAEREEKRRRSDDVRLQLAISQSQNDFQSPGATGGEKKPASNGQSHLLDLLDVSLGPPQPTVDPWGLPGEKPKPDTSSEAWSGVNSPARDPWAPAAPDADPWAPLAQSKSPISVISSPSSDLEQFDALSQRQKTQNNHEQDPFDLSGLGGKLSPPISSGTGAIKKSPSAFLGENSSLVNLERLLQPAAAAPPAAPNPFAPLGPLGPQAPETPRQMFAQPQPAKLSINEIKQQQMGLASNMNFPSSSPAFNAPLNMSAPMPPLPNNMGSMPTMPPLGSTMPPLGSNMPLGGVPLSGAPLGAADPWSPSGARAASPWSPPPARHTPNPFLS